MRIAAIVFALCLCACASAPPHPQAATPAADRTVQADIDVWRVHFQLGNAWKAPPPDPQKNAAVLARADGNIGNVILMLDPASPGDQAGDKSTQWEIRLLQNANMLFDVTGVEPPRIESEGSASFVISGVHSANLRGKDVSLPMNLTCLVQIVSGHGQDAWLIIFSITPGSDAAQTLKEMYRITRSLQLEPLR